MPQFIQKILLPIVLVQVALVLAKQYDEFYDPNDGTFLEGDVEKRATDCGGACEPEGCFSKRCRSSCRSKEYHVSTYDNKCSGNQKCCMCHVGWHNGCAYDS